MRRASLVALAVAFAGCVGGPSDQGATSNQASSASAPHVAVSLTPSQQEGQVIYQTVCWSCHGSAGRGDGPAVTSGALGANPPSFHTPEYEQSTAQALANRFQATLGANDARHPHMQYVASVLRPEKFTAALSYVAAISYPPEIPGSAIAGQEIYAFRCVGCHGPGGRGNGTAAASLLVTKPADFVTDTLIASKDWDAVFAKVRAGGRGVHGSSMPPWGVVLPEDQIWDLVAYIATFQPGLLSKPSWQ